MAAVAPSSTSSAGAVAPGSKKRSVAKSFTELMITLFPAWAIAASVAAYQTPAMFSDVGPLTVRFALAGIMLTTGLSLTGAELKEAAARPGPLSLGLLGCFVGMPLMALIIAQLFALTGPVKAGFILLGAVSGGQMSNLCTNISRGDTALSVAMTSCSTLAAAFALPILAQLLLATTVPVDPIALAASTISFVLAPVLLGAALSKVAKPLQGILPLLGIFLVLVLIVGPVAQTQTVIAAAFRSLALPVCLLHAGGGMMGYFASKYLGQNEKVARAMGFEMGFKSPALSFVLAQAHFSNPAVSLASAVSIVTLAPLGAFFAVVLRLFPPKDDANTKSMGDEEKKILQRRLRTSPLSGPSSPLPVPSTVIDTRSLRLADDEKLRMDADDEFNEFIPQKAAWRTRQQKQNAVSTVSTVGPRPIDDATRYRILAKDVPNITVHYGGLSSKLQMLRNRGIQILGVERIV